MNCEVLVIGGGFAGLSTAYYLAQARVGPIAVIERDAKLGGHSSGRNAGMIRQAISDPVLIQLAREGRKRLSLLKQAGWRNIDYRSIGSLLLAKEDKLEELKNIAACLKKERIPHAWLSAAEAARRVEVLKDADFEKALFCPSDAVIEINALIAAFLDKLKEHKVKVFLNYPLADIHVTAKGFEVQAGGQKFFAKKIVNAAGAWAGVIGEIAGASHVPLKAYRRHLFTSAPFGVNHRAWPFVWDLSHDFYFRPQGEGLLLSPCDKVLFDLPRLKKKNFVEKVDSRMKKALFKKINSFSSHFGGLRIQEKKSGLRTMAPDGRFVIGEDAKLNKFFWVAGLGGHGVTTCFAVGRLAADLISGRKVESQLKKNLSPVRFQ